MLTFHFVPCRQAQGDVVELKEEETFSSSNGTEMAKMASIGKESELEEDGEATFTSLGVVGMIVAALSAYVLYWFCCSASSKGFGKQQFVHYEEDLDTDEFGRRYKAQSMSYPDGVRDDEDSDWSEDEQLGVDDDRKRKQEKRAYDVSVHDMNSMPIHNETTDDEEEEVEVEETEDQPRNEAVEVRIDDDENETFQFDDD